MKMLGSGALPSWNSIPSTCRYVEIRRAGYEMEREAIGVLLSRVLYSGLDEVARASAQLNNWLISLFRSHDR